MICMVLFLFFIKLQTNVNIYDVLPLFNHQVNYNL